MDVQSPEFQEAFIRDMREHFPDLLRLELTGTQALTLIGQLQLALRHPANRGPSADDTRLLVDRLIFMLSVTEVLATGLRAGDCAAYDVASERSLTRPSRN